ncbi:MAG: hypothetical protein MR601_02315 [Erysipelotrichaceae bacterium]|nr:hypothetical protein [Erysipelotrichaceae bacterium]
MKKRIFWIIVSIVLVGIRFAYKYNKYNKNKVSSTYTSEVAKEISEKTNEETQEVISNSISSLADKIYLNGYKIEKNDNEKITIKNSNDEIVYDNVDEYVNTISTLFVVAIENDIYAFNTITNEKYGPYTSAAITYLVKDGKNLNEKGLTYILNDEIKVLTHDNLYDVLETSGTLNENSEIYFDIDSKVLSFK